MTSSPEEDKTTIEVLNGGKLIISHVPRKREK
jgi:hypothetical protein